MNGLLWTAATLAIAGWLAIVVGCFWGRTTNPDDFGAVVVGLILLVLCDGIAIVLAVIGFIVKAT
jgi:hypothetical protein